MQKIYEVRLIINNKHCKYKASISKHGDYCIGICAKSHNEAYEILQGTVYGDDIRPIKNKGIIKDFILKGDCSKYMFLMRKENVDS